jgi:hypothetical protein
MAAITRALKFEGTGVFGNFASASVSRASISKSGWLRQAARSAAEPARRHSFSRCSGNWFSILQSKTRAATKLQQFCASGPVRSQPKTVLARPKFEKSLSMRGEFWYVMVPI